MIVDLVHVLDRRDIATAPANLSGSLALGARTEIECMATVK